MLCVQVLFIIRNSQDACTVRCVRSIYAPTLLIFIICFSFFSYFNYGFVTIFTQKGKNDSGTHDSRAHKLQHLRVKHKMSKQHGFLTYSVELYKIDKIRCIMHYSWHTEFKVQETRIELKRMAWIQYRKFERVRTSKR